VLSWVNHPRALPLAVPAATLHMAAHRGMEVVVLRPEGYALPPPIMDKARRAAAASGGSVTRDRRPRRRDEGRARALRQGVGLDHALRRREGRDALRASLRTGACDPDWFAGAPDCRLMHCLPVRRNVAVTDAVLDGPRSVVLREAYNRMPAQMAVLHRLLAQALLDRRITPR
jgi:N-acetylornithine carbamoyltransferase